MKILFCINSLGGNGGIESVTITKANALADIAGNEVAICYTDTGTYPETIVPLNPKIAVYDLKTPYWGFVSIKEFAMRFLSMVWKTRNAIANVAADFKPDIIITTGSYEKFALALLSKRKLGKLACKENVVKIREYHFNSTYRRFTGSGSIHMLKAKMIEGFEKYLLSRCFDKSYLLTKADRANFPKSKRFGYMYNPCRFTEGLSPDLQRKKTVIAVGRLSTEKNFTELVRIWAMIAQKHPDWKLRIVGSGYNEEQKIRELIKSFGIEKSVELPGFSKEIRKEMNQASVYAMTSLYEGCALVLCEAQACGLPIVSYRTPYSPDEIVRDGQDGYIIECGDKQSFADRLESLMEDEDLRHKMGISAVNRVKEFSLEKIISRWMGEYQKILKR